MGYRVLMSHEDGDKFVLPGVQSISERINPEFVSISISRIMIDDWSLLTHAMNKGPVDIYIEVGEGEKSQILHYKELKVLSGERRTSIEDYIIYENIEFRSVKKDSEIEELKDTLRDFTYEDFIDEA